MPPEPKKRHRPIEKTRREALSAGAVMAVSVVLPVLVGTVTMIYEWPTVPFGIACATSVALFSVAQHRLHETRIAEHIRDSEERVMTRMDKHDRSWHRSLGKARQELLDAVRSDAIDRVTESVREADRRNGLRGI